jgi:hypothetical protein
VPVDIAIVLSTARQVYGLYSTLKFFVEDEMATFLRDMGERQFDAAVQHLENGTRAPERMSDYTLLAIHSFEDAYRTFEASAPTGFRAGARSLLSPVAQEQSSAYGKACAAVLFQSMCYKYLQDEANAKVYLGKAEQFFEKYAKAEKTVLYNRERAAVLMYQSRKYGPLIKNQPVPSIADTKAAVDREIDAQRKQLEALSR